MRATIVAALVVAVVLGSAYRAAAQTVWVASGTGNWFAPGNWSAGVPIATSDARINNAGTAQLFDNAQAFSLALGFNPGNSGTVEVTGGIASLKRLFVALEGLGELNILNAGKVFSEQNSIIGYISGSNGAVMVDGSMSRWVSHSTDFNSLSVGVSGTGALSVLNGGGVASLGGGFIGQGTTSHGTATVSGENSYWSSVSDLIVGESGAGELSIQNGGRVTNNNGIIGSFAGSTGTVHVIGAGSVWQNGVVAVGISGTGSLTIDDGGVVNGTNGRIGREPNSTGAVTVDGIGSQWNCTGAITIATSSFPPSLGTLTLRDGGAVSALGGVTINAGGSLQGTGIVTANVTNLNRVAPGTSPGTLQVVGNYTQHSILGQLYIDLASATDFDKLVVTGGASLGGLLRVQLFDGYVPQAGASFDILDWGSQSGTFAAVDLPPLPSPLAWNTAQLYVNGTLSVTSPYLAADFDENFAVNGADLAKWKMGFGVAAGAAHMQGDADFDHDVDAADFLTWQRQLGSTEASPMARPVPEPASAMCGLLATALWAVVHRRAKRPLD